MTDFSALSCTAEELAALAGISARHIRRLGIPKAGRNRYLLADAVPALIETMSGGDAGAELTRERVRLTKAQADKAELEYAKAREEVAPIAEMQRAWMRQSAMIQARMMQIPQRAVVQLVGETDESRVKAVLRNEIAAALQSASEEESTPEDVEDEPENDSEPFD